MSDRTVRPRARRPSLRQRAPQRPNELGPAVWGWGVAAGALTGALLTVRRQPDVDLWLHLRIGDLLLHGGRFGELPDPLALLPDRPYVPTQWLAQASMSGIYTLGGMTAIQVLRIVLVVVLVGLILVACRTVAGPAAAAAATTIAAFASSASWGERPQLLGMVLLGVTVALWWRALVLGRLPWVLVPVTWFWACIHGTWLFGIALGVLFVVGAALDRTWRGRALLEATAVPAASLVVGAITPLGIATLTEPFRVSEAARLFVSEWQRPTLTNPLLVVMLVAAAISLASLVVRSPHRWVRGLMTLAGALLALWMVRTIASGAVVLAPALAMGLTVLGTSRKDGRQKVSSSEWSVWVVAGVIAAGVGVWNVARTDWLPPVSGVVAAALGGLSPDTPLAVDGRAVGWVQLTHPDLRPMKDLRAEVYSLRTTREYKVFQEAEPGWQQYVTDHDIRAVLADRKEPLDSALAKDGAWRTAAEDPHFRLWVRR